jgi:outer membrane receptor protein involved in Fe transport
MTLPRRTLRLALAALALVLPPLATDATAQGVTTGAITGTVTTEQGTPLDAVQIQVVNRGTGFTAGGMTRSNGIFTIHGLEVGGNYAVTARRLGFRPQTRENVTVALGQTTRTDFRLEQQAAMLAGVTVTATEADRVISPSRTGVQTNVTDTVLRRMPTLNRNFTDFVQLTPQVSTSGPGLSGGGTNNRYNNIQIDGSIETDLFGLGSTGQPGGQAAGKSIALESVKEYQVLLSPYDVRQGNFAGLLVNAVTKSGTNELSGSVYGVTRNETLARDTAFVNDYKQSQYGFSLGGPIIRNKVFYFVNPEFQERSTPAGGIFLGQPGVNLQPAAVEDFKTALQSYGLPAPGSAGIVNNENPLANVFVRFDFNLPRNSQLVLRHNYGHAEDDNLSRSASEFRLADNAYTFKSDKNGTVGQLRTLFGNSGFNELLVGYTTIRDRRAPVAGRTPQISLRTQGFTLVSGAERFSQGNELDQDVFEVTENFTFPTIAGAHSVTIGTQNQFYRVRNLFTQSSYGAWLFGNLDSLQRGIPNQYIIGVPLSGDGAVRFRAAQYAAYIQDVWTVNPRLNFTFGIRADIPTFRDKPPANAQVTEFYQRNTQDVPSGNIQWSPRFGFNWNVTGDDRNQLRGGVGMFMGRPAFVWMSNAFQNSGSVGVAVLTCNLADQPPAFTTQNAQNPPTACGNGRTPQAGGEINLLDPDLKFPQNLRATLGFDRRLGDNWTGTLEGLFTWGVQGLFYRNIALLGVATGNTRAGQTGIIRDRYGRVIYGAAPSNPDVVPGGRTQIFDVTNQSKDRAYNLTVGLQRRFLNNYSGSLHYTYSRAWDVQSFTSSTAFSQYRFGRVWGGDQRDQTATRSMFEQPHRIVATGTYTLPTKTDVTVMYVGESGTPYGYVVNGDPNGDGITLNDPIYVPRNVTDPNEITFAATRTYGGTVYTSAQMAAALERFIDDTPCLRNNRGRLLPRNECDNPWTNEINVSLRQSLQTLRGQNVTLQLDIFNFANLLNDRWGHSPTAGFGSQSLLDYVTRTPSTAPLESATPVYAFNPGYRKFLSENIFSVYQIQLQARYSF